MSGCTIINDEVLEDVTQTTCSSTPSINTPCGEAMAALEALTLLEPEVAVSTTKPLTKVSKGSNI